MTGAMTGALLSLGKRGDRPAVVVCGSIASDERAWQTQFAAWGGGDREIHFYRYPGHAGRANGPTALTTLAALADDLLAALDAQGVGSFDFIGLSLGAMLGLQLAASRNPQLQRLVACCCRFEQTPELQAQWNARVAAVGERGMVAIAQPTLERWLTAPFRAREPAIANAVLSAIVSTHPAGYAAAAAAVRDVDLAGKLPLLGDRALVLSAELDASAPPAHMATLAAALGAAHVQLPGCAHLPPVERPTLFNAAVAGWLA